MNLHKTLLSALCAMFLFLSLGCDSRRVEVYVHQDTGCQSDTDCDASYGENTSSWCEVGAGNGTCHYETLTWLPACSYDWECNDGNAESTDSCNIEGCTHTIHEVVIQTVNVPSCVIDADCDDGDMTSVDSCESTGCVHIIQPTRTDSAVVASFGLKTFSTVAREGAWINLGDLLLESFSAEPELVSKVSFYGSTFSNFATFALAQNGAVVATGASNVSQGTTEIALNRTVTEGEPQVFQLWGMVDIARYRELASYDLATTVELYVIELANADTHAYIADRGHTLVRLRETMPYVTRQALASTTLTNSDLDLYKVQISADANHYMNLHSLSFKIDGQSSNGTLSDFRVRRGNLDMAPSEYTVVRSYVGTDLYNGTYTISDTVQNGSFLITVVFTTPLTISGSGSVFTLHAAANGFVTGDYLNTMFGNNSGIDGSCGSNGSILIPGYGYTYFEAIVWDDGLHSNKCLGTQSVNDLNQSQLLTR